MYGLVSYILKLYTSIDMVWCRFETGAWKQLLLLRRLLFFTVHRVRSNMDG